MFNGANLTLILMWIKTHRLFGLHERSLTYRCIIALYIQIKIYKGDKSEIITQHYTQLNTRAQEIKQLISSGPDQRHDIRSTDIYLFFIFSRG